MNYKEVFRRFWDTFDGYFMQCWFEENGIQCGERAVDIAHIRPKGMGGRASVNFIENFCPLCRKHHALTEGKAQYMLLLFRIVCYHILLANPYHEWTELFQKDPLYNQIWEDDRSRQK